MSRIVNSKTLTGRLHDNSKSSMSLVKSKSIHFANKEFYSSRKSIARHKPSASFVPFTDKSSLILHPNPSFQIFTHKFKQSKLTQNHIKELKNELDYNRILKKAADIQDQLKSFIFKTARKSIKQKLESIEKTQRTKLKHYKGKEFLKCVKNGDFDQVVLMLSDYPELVKFSDSTDQTALHWACKRGYFEIVKHLVKCNANTNAIDLVGRMPEAIAKERNHSEILAFMYGLRRRSRQNTANFSRVF